MDSEVLSVGGNVTLASGSVLRFDTSALPAEASYASIELYFAGANSQSGNSSGAVPIILGTPRGLGGETSTLGEIGDSFFESILPAPETVGWYRIEITGIYNGWQDGTRANWGVILLPSGPSTPISRFHSSDYSDPALRSRLVVHER